MALTLRLRGLPKHLASYNWKRVMNGGGGSGGMSLQVCHNERVGERTGWASKRARQWVIVWGICFTCADVTHAGSQRRWHKHGVKTVTRKTESQTLTILYKPFCIYTCRVNCFPFAILLFSKYKLRDATDNHEADWSEIVYMYFPKSHEDGYLGTSTSLGNRYSNLKARWMEVSPDGSLSV